MLVGVRLSNGTAMRYPETMTKRELERFGYRPATEKETKKYWELKPLFEAHKIQCIKLF